MKETSTTDLMLSLDTLNDTGINDLKADDKISVALLRNSDANFVISYEVKKGALLTIYNTKLSPGPVTVIAEGSDGKKVVLGTIARGKNLFYVAEKDEADLKLFVKRAAAGTGLYIGISSVQYNQPLEGGKDTIISKAIIDDDNVQFVLSYAVQKGGLVSIYNTTQSPGPVLITAIGSSGEILDIGRIAPNETLYYVSPTAETDLRLSVQRAEPIDGLYVGISASKNP